MTDYVAKAQAGVEGFALGFDVNTAAGSANQAMLSDLVADAQAAAAAQLALDRNTAGYIDTITAGNQRIYENAMALGATKDQARYLADNIAAIPDAKTVQILAETSTANAAIDATLAKLDNLRAIFGVPIAVNVGTGVGVLKSAGGKADGGAIPGPGTGTSDTAGLFRLSNGEHVLDAEAVAKMGGQAGVYAFRQSLYAGATSVRGNADGGAVQYAAPAQYAYQATPPSGCNSERPIMMDGTLFGMREMANGEARIVANEADGRLARVIATGPK